MRKRFPKPSDQEFESLSIWKSFRVEVKEFGQVIGYGVDVEL